MATTVPAHATAVGSGAVPPHASPPNGSVAAWLTSAAAYVFPDEGDLPRPPAHPSTFSAALAATVQRTYASDALAAAAGGGHGAARRHYYIRGRE